MSAKDNLSKAIALVFPVIDMPISGDLTRHEDSCYDCRHLRKDLEDYRNKDVTNETTRLAHQELSHFSAKGLRWLLPHYLRFCLTTEAEFTRMETEFFIFHFSPSAEFQTDVSEQLRGLDRDQINCLIHFFNQIRTPIIRGCACGALAYRAVAALRELARKGRQNGLNSGSRTENTTERAGANLGRCPID